MKKLLAFILLSILALQPLRAQEVSGAQTSVPDYPRNEIGLSLSVGTDLQALAIAGSMLTSIVGTIINNDTFAVIPIFVPVNLEYNRWLTERLAVGVDLSTDTVSALPYIIVSNISVMPDVKYKWLSFNRFGMYSKLAAGGKWLLVGSRTEEGMKLVEGYSALRNDTADINLFDRGVSFTRYVMLSPVAWQLSPLCFEVSTAAGNLDFFLELGYGVQGAFTFGLKKLF